jgi:DNA-binding transcriptional regulator YiaG
MHIENREFKVSVPTVDGEDIAELVSIFIPMEWDPELEEWLMTEEGLKKVEDTKARHMGLLLPHELKALRERLGLTQKEISEVLQIGEKVWSPWENGRLRPSRSMNLLLRALEDGKITVDYLKAVSQPILSWKPDAYYMSFAQDPLFEMPNIDTQAGMTGKECELEEQFEEAMVA